MKITVELPWMAYKYLSPNYRGHTKYKAEIVASTRATAKMLTRNKYDPMQVVLDQPLVCCRIFFPPDRRYRDTDNLGASVKAYQDGIFDALETDDRLIVETRNRRCEPKGDGLVIFVIYPEKGEDNED